MLAWLTFRNYGFSDGADLFVFISGYTSAFVYARKNVRSTALFSEQRRLLKRVWQIYAAHVLLFVFYIIFHPFLSHTFDMLRRSSSTNSMLLP